MEIKVGSRVQIKSKKTGTLIQGKISTIKGGIAKMINDEGDYFIKAPANQFEISNEPVKASTLKKFKFEAWIHPKSGGDDYKIAGHVLVHNKEEAEIEIGKNLKRKSAILDYKIL